MLNNQIIYEFDKNSVERVRAELSNYQGKDLVNLRVYYNAGKTTRDWKPTRKGLALRFGLIPQLKLAVDKVFGEYEKLNGNKRKEGE